MSSASQASSSLNPKQIIQDDTKKAGVSRKSSAVNLPTFIIDNAVPILSGSVGDFQVLENTGSNPYPSMARPRKSFSALDREISNSERTPAQQRSVSEGQSTKTMSAPFLNIIPDDSSLDLSSILKEKRKSSVLDTLSESVPAKSSGMNIDSSISYTDAVSSTPRLASDQNSPASSPSFKSMEHSPTSTSVWKATTSKDLPPQRPAILTNSSSSTSHRNVQVIQSPSTSYSNSDPNIKLDKNSKELDSEKRQSESSSNGHSMDKSTTSSSPLDALPAVPRTSQTSISSNNSPQTETIGTPTLSQHATFSPLSPSTNISSRSRNASGQHVNYPNPMQGINFRANDPSEWTLERVLKWLEHNKFGQDWVETFRKRNIHGAEFLSLVSYQKLKDLGHLSSSNDIYSTTPSRFIHILRKVFDRSSSTSNGTTEPQSFQADTLDDDPLSTYNTYNSIELFYNSEATPVDPRFDGEQPQNHNGSHQDSSSSQKISLPVATTSHDSEIDPQQVRVRSSNTAHLRPLSTMDLSSYKQVSETSSFFFLSNPFQISPSSPTAFSNIFSRKHAKSSSSESFSPNPIQPTLSGNILSAQEDRVDKKSGLLNKLRRRDKDGNRDRLRASKSATNLFEVQSSAMGVMTASSPTSIFPYGHLDVQFEPVKPKVEPKIILVTTTNEHFTTINISGVTTVDELKMLIADKLSIDDWPQCTFHLTEFGCSEGQALDEDTLSDLVFDPSKIGFSSPTILKIFVGYPPVLGALSPGQLSMEYEFSTNTSHYPTTPSYLIHTHPPGDLQHPPDDPLHPQPILQVTSEPPDYFSHKPLEQAIATSPQAPLLTQQQQISFQEYIRNINHHSNKNVKQGLNIAGRGVHKSSAASILSGNFNGNYNQPDSHFNGSFLHPFEDNFSFRDPSRLSVASIDYTGRRSSEDSFKVIRPERREINFDDRRSSPYDRRPSINPSLNAKSAVASERAISIPSASSSSSSSTSTLPLIFSNSNNTHVATTPPSLNNEESHKSVGEEKPSYSSSSKNDTSEFDPKKKESSEKANIKNSDKAEEKSEGKSKTKAKIHRQASIRTSRIYRSAGAEDSKNEMTLDPKSTAETSSTSSNVKSSEGKLSRQSSRLDRTNSVKLVPKRAAPPPPTSSASTSPIPASHAGSLPKQKTQLHRTTSVITRGSSARGSSRIRSNITDSTGNFGHISESFDESPPEIRRVSDSAIPISDSTGRKMSFGSSFGYTSLLSGSGPPKLDLKDMGSGISHELAMLGVLDSSAGDRNSLYGVKEESRQSTTSVSTASGLHRQPSAKVSGLSHSLSRRSHRATEDNEAKFHENVISFADAPTLEESDEESGSSSDEGLWAKRPPKLADEKKPEAPEKAASEQSSTQIPQLKTPVPIASLPPAQLRRLSQSLSTITSPPPLLSGSPPPPLPTSSPMKLTAASSFAQNVSKNGQSGTPAPSLQPDTNINSSNSSGSLSSSQPTTPTQSPRLQQDGTFAPQIIYQPFKLDQTTSPGSRPTLHVDVVSGSDPVNNMGKMKSATPMTPMSFSDINMNGWAVRPPAEVVYENLERFFPDADLDRPIILDPQGVSPPASPIGDYSSVRSHYLPPLSPVVEPNASQDAANTATTPTATTSNSSLNIVSNSHDEDSTLTVPMRRNLAALANNSSPASSSDVSAAPMENKSRRPSGTSTLMPQQRGSAGNTLAVPLPNNGRSQYHKSKDSDKAASKTNEVDFSNYVKKTEPGSVTGNKNKLTMRTKSLRIVVQEATERRKRFQSLANLNTKGALNVNGPGAPGGVVLGGSPAALLRRKSTKVWGQKVVEVKPNAFRSGGQQLSRLRDNRGKVKQFVWVKGELIGKGTFGKVYLALNATAGEMIAVKQVEVPHTLSDKNSELQKEVVDALHAEVETMKDLDHFNIVQYLGFEALPDVYNLFLEYVPGGTVGMALRKHGRFEASVSQYFTRQVLEGLSYLHSCGILHRDLKSDNILIDLDGVCKISDFGISKKSRNIYANDAAMSMQGTIFWMAPEVIHNVVDNEKQGYSAKVDIWSLGCVVLEMFAGRRPWSTDEAIGAMYKVSGILESVGLVLTSFSLETHVLRHQFPRTPSRLSTKSARTFWICASKRMCIFFFFCEDLLMFVGTLRCGRQPRSCWTTSFAL